MSSIRLKHASGNSMSLAAPGTNPASNLELKLPHTIGSANQLLKVDGSGQLGWATDSTTDSTKLPLAGGTLTGTLNIGNGSITTGSNFSLNGNALTVTGTSTVVGEFKRAGSPTIQCTDTTNNTDLQLRANSTGGLVRTASNHPLVFGTNQQERLRVTSAGYVGIGVTSPNKTGIQNNVSVLQIDSGDGAELILGNSVSSNVSTNHIGAIAFKNIDSSTGSAPHYAGIRCNCTDTSGNMNLKFYAGGGGGTGFEDDTPDMLIDSIGRVGIGTASPNLESVPGNSAKGLEIHNNGNDTAGCLKLAGNNNSGGSPGQKTYTQLEHRGGNLTFNINHNGTERFKIDSQGNIHASDGNFVVANGHGIDFSATSDGPSQGNETLDDYERGTYTPQGLAWSGSDWATVTFDSISRYGRYTKIGGLVHVQGYLSNFHVDSSFDNQLAGITLPFAAVSASYHYSVGVTTHSTAFSSSGYTTFFVNPATSNMYSMQENTTSYNTWSGSSGRYLMFQVSYMCE